MSDPKLYIPETIYRTLEVYANAVDIEIGGLGRASVSKDCFTVEEIYLVEQKAHGAECEYDDTSIALLMEELISAGKDPTLNFMWHSHVNMSTSFSGQDKSTIEKWSGDWLVSLVINKKMEMTSCLSTVYQVPKELQDFFSRTTSFKLEPVILRAELPNKNDLIAEAKAKVHETHFQNGWQSNYKGMQKVKKLEEVIDVEVSDLVCSEICGSITCLSGDKKCSDTKLRDIACKVEMLTDEEEEYLTEKYEENYWEDYNKIMQSGWD